MKNYYFKTDETEFYPTPQEAVNQLWTFFPDELKNKKINVFDCCAGAGALCHPNNFDTSKINFIKWDLIPRAKDVEQYDFLTSDLSSLPKIDLAVLNPPFQLAKEFIDKLLTITDKILLVAPKSLFKKYNFNTAELYDCFENPRFYNGENKRKIAVPIYLGLINNKIANPKKEFIHKQLDLGFKQPIEIKLVITDKPVKPLTDFYGIIKNAYNDTKQLNFFLYKNINITDDLFIRKTGNHYISAGTKTNRYILFFKNKNDMDWFFNNEKEIVHFISLYKNDTSRLTNKEAINILKENNIIKLI